MKVEAPQIKYIQSDFPSDQLLTMFQSVTGERLAAVQVRSDIFHWIRHWAEPYSQDVGSVLNILVCIVRLY